MTITNPVTGETRQQDYQPGDVIALRLDPADAGMANAIRSHLHSISWQVNDSEVIRSALRAYVLLMEINKVVLDTKESEK